jgi:hypothetical protein
MGLWRQSAIRPTANEDHVAIASDAEVYLFRETGAASPEEGAIRIDFRNGSWPCQNGLQDRRWQPGPGLSQAAIAAIRGLTPTMFMTRVRL